MRKTIKLLRNGEGKKKTKSNRDSVSLSDSSVAIDPRRRFRKSKPSDDQDLVGLSKSEPLLIRDRNTQQQLLNLQPLEFNILDDVLRTMDDRLSSFFADVDKRGQTVLHILVTAAKLDVLQYLVFTPANVAF